MHVTGNNYVIKVNRFIYNLVVQTDKSLPKYMKKSTTCGLPPSGVRKNGN